jgi:hypothetical protein
MHVSGLIQSGILGPNKKSNRFDCWHRTEHRTPEEIEISFVWHRDEVTESNKSKEACRELKKGHNLGHRIKDHPPQSNNSMKNPPSEKP